MQFGYMLLYSSQCRTSARMNRFNLMEYIKSNSNKRNHIVYSGYHVNPAPFCMCLYSHDPEIEWCLFVAVD